MSLHVYPNRQGSVVVSHDNYDEAKGALGRLVSKSDSIGESESLDDATEIAYAHLGRVPSEAVYIADENDVVRKIVFNDAYHKERETSERWLCASVSLLILCLTSFVGTIASGIGIVGLLIFVVIAILYLVVVRTRIQNEVEGAVVCFIILVLIFLLLPAIKAVRDRTAGNVWQNKSMQASRFSLMRSLRSFDAVPRPPDL